MAAVVGLSGCEDDEDTPETTEESQDAEETTLVDVSGYWYVQYWFPNGGGNPDGAGHLNLEQSGNELGGTFESVNASSKEGDVSGQLSGSDINLTIEDPAVGTLTVTATVSDGAMKGTYTTTGKDGPWEAGRVESVEVGE